MATAQRGGQSSKSCFKCGKPGHWSRDCTAPREEWVPSTYVPGQTGAKPAAAEVPPEGTGAEAPPPPQPKRAAKRQPRRKLTIADLTSPAGLPHVCAAFQAQLRASARGPGHEAGDLRRLLELYRGWHARFFPELPFELFVEKLEALGGAARQELRLMRRREVHGERFGEDVDAAAREEEEEEEGNAGFAEAAGRANAAAAAAARPPPLEKTEEDMLIEMGLEEDDEDELEELMGM